MCAKFTRNGWHRRNATVVRALGMLLVLAAPAGAQTAGTVSGVVVDGTTGEPLSGAQVAVPGTDRGTLTTVEGRFLIPGVPAGEHVVEVMYIGYRAESQSVQVRAGETATLRFELGVSAVALEQVVVTGTAGEVERRKVGASLATLNVAQVQELTPVQSVGTALQARIPGVRSIGTVGGVGASRDLRIRGVSSFSLGQRPVVYIDGVRIDTRQTEWGGMSGVTCCAFSGGAGEDRLSDLNPDDIARIEVLKGAAATTLYGSEATNGVIQIFTKKGRSGTPAQWSASFAAGLNRHRANFPTKLYPNFTGPDGFRAWDGNETLIENGYLHSYDLSVRGGAENITYFVSGAYSDEEGSLKPNWQKRGNLRLNLSFIPAEEWVFDVTSAYSRNTVWALQSGNNWLTMLGQVNRGNPRSATAERPYGEPWVAIEDVKAIETISKVNRFTGGVTATYTPLQNFSNRFMVGLDYVNDEKTRILPFGRYYVNVGEVGEKNVGYRGFSSFTFDYLGSIDFEVSSGIQSELAFGAQGFWEVERLSMATGRGYAGPGVTTVGGGAETFGDEEWKETINIGFFGQNRFSINDELFTTIGVRVDGNSAFGVNYGLKAYPKADVSYVLSDAFSLPAPISSLRVRGAIGMSGLAPGAYDQFLTFGAVPVLDDQPGVTPLNPGNPELKPETTREIEGGFEVGLFEDRLGIEFSAYHALTTDALLPVDLPASAGFDQPQLQNAGKILNTGWGLAINAFPVATQRFRWHAQLNLDHNRNEILDLGPTAIDGKLGDHREGYEVNAIFTHVMVDYDPETRTHTRSDTAVYMGGPLPTYNASLVNTFEYGPFQLHALVSAETGAHFDNHERRTQARFLTGDEYLATLDANQQPTAQSDSLKNYMDLFEPIEERDNIRLREVSLTYELPSPLVDGLGLGRTTVSLAGQNLHWWDNCHCMDPNGAYRGGADFGAWQEIMYAVPQPRRFVFTVRTNF